MATDWFRILSRVPCVGLGFQVSVAFESSSPEGNRSMFALCWAVLGGSVGVVCKSWAPAWMHTYVAYSHNCSLLANLFRSEFR